MGKIKPVGIRPNNGTEFSIRTAESNDAAGVLKIMKEVVKEKRYTIHEINEFHENKKSYTDKINKFIKSRGKLFLVAEINGTIAGFVNFNNWDTEKTKHTGFLSIFILKKFRGYGIGEALMNELIKWAKANPMIKKMSLAVFENNKNAIKLYNKIGFKFEGMCPKDIKIGNKFYSSIFMYIFTP
jgi:RimJ/RimL family protein N-acetyltransferase